MDVEKALIEFTGGLPGFRLSVIFHWLPESRIVRQRAETPPGLMIFVTRMGR
jgi:hypothetical protein